ncbi:MAG TPA: Tad domain-containing protein [Candidatus Limnocylindrales bacterium]
MTTSRRRAERGQVIALAALFMVVLLLFAAVVIDSGRLYLEHRQDVAGADAGVLAGAARLLVKTTLNKDQVGQDAVEVARQNITPVPSVTVWNDLFAVCTDSDRDMTLYPAGNNFRPKLGDGRYTDCVHFNPSFTKMRIRLPDQIVSTSFARLAGIPTMRTNAVAEAVIGAPLIGSRTLPIAILPGQGNANDLLCFRLDKQNCGSVPGNQGARILDAPLFSGAPSTLRTDQNCGSMNSTTSGTSTSSPTSDSTIGTRAVGNAAMGTDHPIVVFNTSSGARRYDDCGAAAAPPTLRTPTDLPNYVWATQFDSLPLTGARPFITGVGQGLAFSSPTAFPDGAGPRLHRFPTGGNWSAWPTRDLTTGSGVYTVDDRPLWDFIRPNATNIPAICARSSFNTINPSDPDNTGPTMGHMVNCLKAWNSSNAALFDYQTTGAGTYTSCVATGDPCDIQYSPRAGIVPVVGAPEGNNYPASPITGFQVAFLQTLYFSGGTLTYSAGTAPTGTGTITDLFGLGAFAIQDLMLPPQARPQPPNSLPGSVSLYR